MTKSVEAFTIKEWRTWLRKNPKETKVYLIRYKKHTGKPTFNNMEAMRTAICFGWIDTTIKRLDEDRYQQCYMKRSKNSRWSNNTLRYARELIKEKKMTKEGMKWYLEGLKKPTIDHNFPKNPDIPKQLEIELKKNKLLEKFKKLSPSNKRLHIYSYLKAVKQETKDKRIKEVISAIKL